MKLIAPIPIIIFIALLWLIFWLATNVNHSAAMRILQETNYKNIQITGYNWFACSSDDWSHTGFIAENSSGTLIKGTVCCGLIFKNCTIRFK